MNTLLVLVALAISVAHLFTDARRIDLNVPEPATPAPCVQPVPPYTPAPPSTSA